MNKSTPLVIGISSRVLFDLSESHEVFQKEGLIEYQNHQIKNENTKLDKGPAFDLVKKLLSLNTKNHRPIEIVLISRNSADTGLRIFNSIERYNLPITRAVFCGGRDPFSYITPFSCQLFLSADESDVRNALVKNVAAARIIHAPPTEGDKKNEVRIAFDGDAVLFSDDSERIYQKKGLEAFQTNEEENSNNALPGGPFKGFLAALNTVQMHYSADSCPIRTALVTARSAPAHKRVILTLRKWNIRIDESFFLGGMPKKEFLKAFQTDIFFDDQTTHCQQASEKVTTGHVPYGFTNNAK